MQSNVGHAVAAGITGKLLRALNWFQRRAGALIIASMLALAVFHKVKKSRSPSLSLSPSVSAQKKATQYRFSVLGITTFSLKGASADIGNDHVRAKKHGRNKQSVKMQPSKKDIKLWHSILYYIV